MRRVGCKRVWDYYQAEEDPCQHIQVKYLTKNLQEIIKNLQQLVEFETAYIELGSLDIEDVITVTGCPRPCRYTRYTLPAEPKDISYFNASLVSLVLASATVTKRTEVLMYPLETLVAETGGALGMFLGFSFMMFWNWLEHLLNSASHFKQIF